MVLGPMARGPRVSGARAFRATGLEVRQERLGVRITRFRPWFPSQHEPGLRDRIGSALPGVARIIQMYGAVVEAMLRRMATLWACGFPQHVG